ncbi:hypothetical protein E0Z10_g1025 [Xylaria hypoxylon]|uniref:Uncharacterized protein n=1 Tax=Xylaria hypoxylon TaxID=37992 RepID=A0A4Z0Z9U5_9PEZI|nr:hypothetical protein E0Z10_g1025 [Xylaria hypoxylon]
MKVIVVGAGIGGLGAAIALNRAGHDVEVYESSSFLNEVGAAIHLAPNATRVLKSWDCSFETMFPVECEAVRAYSKNLKLLRTVSSMKMGQEKLGITDPWLMVHRVDLHNGLRSLASRGFQGRPVNIHLNSKVESVNAETGEVHFQDGRTVRGDLVVGADGLHSQTIQAVLDNGRDKISTGQKVFRFLVPVEKANTNPSVKNLVNRLGLNQTSVIGPPRGRLIIYPCRSGTLLNCGFLTFATQAEDLTGRESSWLDAGNVEDLVGYLDGFDDGVRELCKMGEDLKLWSLMTRDPPPTYVKGKLALIGDAAHPMLPRYLDQGQGGAQALEDAATLGALFGADTAPGQVNDLLNIYNEVRYEHTVIICITSRVGQDIRSQVLNDLRRFLPNATITENPALDAWSSYPVREVERLLALRRNEKAL